ncbi:MAG: DUF433 domain-containing protein [Elusimicrobia bacterium]|nr:DUF433 domain-containing protein [Elusimicrobiota bacterium]
MNISRHIWTRPDVCHGKPCFKGTRIPVYLVLELMEAGFSADDIMKRCYPELTKKSI